MLNYFSDNQDLEFTLQNLELAEITAMLEKDYKNAEKFESAPADFKDALDNYERSLKIIGEIAAERIEARSRTVDQVGAQFKDGKVIYHPLTLQNLQDLKQAGLMGVCRYRRLPTCRST